MSKNINNIARSDFSTFELAPEERYSVWQDSIGVVFDYSLDERIQVEDFNSEIESYLLGPMMSADCRCRSGIWRRSTKDIAGDGLDMYMLQIFLEGTWKIERKKHWKATKPGDIVVLDLSQPKLTWTSDFRNLTLCVPRALLEPLLNYPDDQNGRILPGFHPMTRLLSNHLMTLHEQAPVINLEEANNLSAPTVELIASVLNSTFDDEAELSKPKYANARVTQIKRFISKNLHRPELNADTICKELYLSRATLYRLSAPFGGVQNFIRKQRLKRCFQDLLNVRFAAQSVFDIGLKWGFNDASSFSRAFKSEFGLTPRELRNEGIPKEHIENDVMLLGNIGDRQYEQWLAHLL